MSEAAKQDSDIVCNQLRSFIVDLLTFFCDNHDCDWTLAYQQLNEFGLKISKLLNQIKSRRQDLQVSGGARGPPGNQTYTKFSTDFEDTFDDYVDDSVFNPFSMLESTEGSSPFDEEIEASKDTLRSIRERLRNLKGQIGIDADSAIEGITSAMGTIGKLRRARNYSNLQGLI